MAEQHLAQHDITQWLVQNKFLSGTYKGKVASTKMLKEVLAIASPDVVEHIGKAKWVVEDMLLVRDLLGIAKRTEPVPYTKPLHPPKQQKPKLTNRQKKERAKLRRIEREEKRASLLTDTKYKALTTKAQQYLDYNFVISSDFLSSVEWKRLRFAVLSVSDGKCSCCGRGKADGIYLNVDHIKPRRLFPELALEESNLQILCNECNEGKGNLSIKDFSK